jgi:hypothetical protein
MKYSILKLTILALLIFSALLVRLKDIFPYDPNSTPGVIRGVFEIMRNVQKDGAPYIVCLNQAMTSKNQAALQEFWANIGKTCQSISDPITLEPFKTFASKILESVTVNDVDQACSDILTNGFYTEETLAHRGVEARIRSELALYFPPPRRTNIKD